MLGARYKANCKGEPYFPHIWRLITWDLAAALFFESPTDSAEEPKIEDRKIGTLPHCGAVCGIVAHCGEFWCGAVAWPYNRHLNSYFIL